MTLNSSSPSDKTAREKLISWSLNEMTYLTQIADVLLILPQHDPPHSIGSSIQVAGPPFRLPFTLNLPDQGIDRWRHHELLIYEAMARISAVKAALKKSDPLLESLASNDHEALKFIQQQISQSSENGGGDKHTSTQKPATQDPTKSARDTDRFEKVGAANSIPVGSVHKITVNGESRVLYHVDPSTSGVDPACPFYATQLYCWHRHPLTHSIHCELSGTGVLQGKVVTCQTAYQPGCAHGSKYDVSTGDRLTGPAPHDKRLLTYATKCINNDVWVKVEANDE